MNAYLFDMDGVLVDNARYHIQAWRECSRKWGRELSLEEIKGLFGRSNRAFMRVVLQREPTDEETKFAEVNKEAAYREFCRPHLCLPDGLRELLEAIRRSGSPCAVATSAPPPNVDFVLDGLRIRSYFSRVIDDSQVKRHKPAPDVYLEAARQVGADPDSCVVFEDSLAGVDAGLAAGMRVIAITTSCTDEELLPHHPTHLIHSFTECRTILPELFV